MHRNLIQLILSVAGALLFNIVFWKEKIAVNAIMFGAFIIGAMFFLYPAATKKENVRWLLMGHLICLAAVVIHNTLLSKIAFVFTLLLLAGFTEYVHRSAWFAVGSIFINFTVFAATFTDSFKGWTFKKKTGFPLGKIIRFAVFPLGILTIFFGLYVGANGAFARFVSSISIYLEPIIDFFLSWAYFPRLMFMIVGLYLVGSILLRARTVFFETVEAGLSDQLERKRRKGRHLSFAQDIAVTVMGKFGKGMMALKNENLTGILSLVLLNLLLLLVNILDIIYVWFNYQYDATTNLSEFVHDGTEILIASILLAMAVLLFFFRGNLNFYKRNKWLKYGATAWIVQNLILVISVGIRDYHYITHFGLAYKRIGVIVFLLLVLGGLITVLIKVYTRKTGYFLFRVNAWAFVFLLVFSTVIHWDELIAGYNLKRKSTIPLDVPFLLSLSDKTVPLIDQNKEILLPANSTTDSSYNPYDCKDCYGQQFESKKRSFVEKQRDYSWLSWNYADAYTKEYLESNAAKLSVK